jgi:fucose permease
VSHLQHPLSAAQLSNRQRKGYIFLVMVFWFVISFITNIMGPLIPDVVANFHLSHLALAGFIPMSFFLAYGVMSIPAGILIEKWNEKAVFAFGFSLPLIGSLLFASIPNFPVLIVSSFIIGLGMAMLQTVINPFSRVAGGEEHFAFYSVMGQLVFGAASFVSPLVYSYLVLHLSHYTGEDGLLLQLLSAITPVRLPWVSLYWVFAFILAIIIVVVLLLKFPRIELRDDERAGSAHQYKQLFKSKTTYLFFFGIMAYVATEQGISNWISSFLSQYHGIDPQVEGASVVGYFWGFLSLGCVLGLIALKLFDSKIVLRVAILMAAISLITSLFGPASFAIWGFPMVGFSLSVMFSIVLSLGLNSVDAMHGAFAGILCSGIVGGAIGPLIVGWIADWAGLRVGLLFPLLTMGYLLYVSLVARPLIANKTMAWRELFAKK